MVNWDFVMLIIFYLILYTIFRMHKNKFEVQWKIFILYKTKIGINLMEKISKKFPKSLSFISNISIFLGFIGMIFTLSFLLKGAISFFGPSPVSQIAPVLPGISIAGLPKLSFWHWIISILIAATIHEFMHGVYSRLNKVEIKSSGFAFLGPILAAFVEPNEKQLEKKSVKAQLSVLSAGPFSNIILGITILIFMIFVISPIGNKLVLMEGIEVGGFNETFAIASSGIKPGDIITEIDNNKINSVENLKIALENRRPNEIVKIKTKTNSYDIKLGENPSEIGKAYLGITINKFITKPKYNNPIFRIFVKVYGWFALLFFWLFNINIGIGLFNLLPLGPVDGGRMFFIAVKKYAGKEKAIRILNYVSLFILFLILINLWPFISKLFNFILAPIMTLL